MNTALTLSGSEALSSGQFSTFQALEKTMTPTTSLTLWVGSSHSLYLTRWSQFYKQIKLWLQQLLKILKNSSLVLWYGYVSEKLSLNIDTALEKLDFYVVTHSHCECNVCVCVCTQHQLHLAAPSKHQGLSGLQNSFAGCYVFKQQQKRGNEQSALLQYVKCIWDKDEAVKTFWLVLLSGMPTMWLYRHSYIRHTGLHSWAFSLLCAACLCHDGSARCTYFIYVWAKYQKSEFFKDNCVCSLSTCIRLLWCVSSTYPADRGERCATDYLSIEVCKQHARGFSSEALHLGLEGRGCAETCCIKGFATI